MLFHDLEENTHEKLNNFVQKHAKALMVLLTLSLLGSVVGYWYFCWHQPAQQSQAVAQVLMIEEMKKNASPEEVFQAAKQASQENSSSSVQPYFLMMQADYHRANQNLDEAINLAKQATTKLNNNMLTDLYQTKLAVMLLESENSSQNEEGLSLLQKVSEQGKPYPKLTAMYHLHMYHWVNQNWPLAQQYGQSYLQNYEHDQKDKSKNKMLAAIKFNLSLLN